MPPQKDDFIEKEIVQAFDLYDADHSGAIDATELRSALQAVGLTVTGTQVDFMLRKYDDDRNMTLQLPEFAQLVRDLKINSPESVQRRMDLRTHPLVVEALDAWWQTAESSMEEQYKAAPAGVKPRVGELQQEQYVIIMRKISKALLEKYDEEEADATAREDWESDRRGHDFLDAELFKDGIFELADLWTNTVSGAEYAAFLWKLFNEVAVKVDEDSPSTSPQLAGFQKFNSKPKAAVSPRRRFWKPDEAISWGGYTEGQVEEKPTLFVPERISSASRRGTPSRAATPAATTRPPCHGAVD